MMRRRSRPRRRAAVLLEFAVVLPFLLFFMLFMVDVGRMIYTANAVQEAAYVAARQSAVWGAAGASSTAALDLTAPDAAAEANAKGGCSASSPCTAFQASRTTYAQWALRAALADTPGASSATDVRVFVTSGAACTASETVVSLRVAYQIEFLAPFMGRLLSTSASSNGTDAENIPARSLSVRATARCETELR